MFTGVRNGIAESREDLLCRHDCDKSRHGSTRWLENFGPAGCIWLVLGEPGYGLTGRNRTVTSVCQYRCPVDLDRYTESLCLSFGGSLRRPADARKRPRQTIHMKAGQLFKKGDLIALSLANQASGMLSQAIGIQQCPIDGLPDKHADKNPCDCFTVQ